MKKKRKVFELECPNKKCPQKRFEITREMREDEAGGVVKEVIECPYCHIFSTYEIPSGYTRVDTIIKGIRH